MASVACKAERAARSAAWSARTTRLALPNFGGLRRAFNLPNGTATNSYWDMQTTGATTSAGGTGMNTAVLAGGLPPGFDPAIWTHGSYPYLVNLGPATEHRPRDRR